MPGFSGLSAASRCWAAPWRLEMSGNVKEAPLPDERVSREKNIEHKRYASSDRIPGPRSLREPGT